MKPITEFNNWILSKINGHLANREGCRVVKSEYTDGGARSIILDAFGFQYEVHVKTIGRTQNLDELTVKPFKLE